jgi:hypothetical protein
MITPIILINTIPDDIKKNSQLLATIIKEYKPNSNIEIVSIKVLGPGAIRVVVQTPHDFFSLHSEWLNHRVYGKIIPKLPKSKTVDQAVIVHGIHPSISEKKIEESLNGSNYYPAEIRRFNPSKNLSRSNSIPLVKLSFDSKAQKDSILSSKLRMHNQLFSVTDVIEDPKIIQCWNCQKFGHESYQCREKLQCPRCGLEHKVKVCNTEIGDATCCNCGGRHSSSYKGCETYKKAVFELK